jgi:TetR/AcrR family transcriptional regulator, mexJK operon transcriptional repressor
VPRRGRPRSAQLEAIERTILATARRMFLSDGFDGVAMESVALEARVAKGTLYSRYASKDALFRSVIEASIADWSATAAVDDYLLTEDIGERLRHHAHVIARYVLDPEVQAFQRLLLANRDRFRELNRAMYEAGYRYIVCLIRDDIQAASVRDEIPVRDAESVATQLVSSLTGWEILEGSGRQVTYEEMIATADRAVSLLMAARSHW